VSSLIFPTLQGLTFDVTRTPVWRTEVQTALSGKRSTLAYQQYPLVHFELSFSILRDDQATSDVKALVGLFNAVQGSYDTFLFIDPDFNTFGASNPQAFGTGNGTAGPFQLVANYANAGGPGYGEIIQNSNPLGFASVTLYDNGSLISSSNYTIGATGLVTFLTGHFPAAGHALTWQGSFFYRCAFDDDKLDLTKFMTQWWTIKKLPFTSVKL
jgi:uncharacterized protein (TIGR02217 family)